MNNSKNTYTKIYLKTIATIISVITFSFSILIFVLSLFYNVITYDSLLALLPIPFGIIIFAFCCLPIFRFYHLINLQEKLLNVEFNAKNAKKITFSPFIFQSDDWLIFSGHSAFHREYIKSFSVKKHYRYGGYDTIFIKTIDKKTYKFQTTSCSDDITLYRKWKYQN